MATLTIPDETTRLLQALGDFFRGYVARHVGKDVLQQSALFCPELARRKRRRLTQKSSRAPR